jgi:cell division protein FtsQ
MRKNISMLFILSLLMISIGTGVYYLYKENSFPVKQIVMLHTLHEQNSEELQKLISKAIDGGFFSLNIEKLRHKLETLAWIDTVSVRKKWPHTLQLDIQEKKVAARWITIDVNKRTINKLKKVKWDKQSLISNKGIVFSTPLTEIQYKKYNKFEIYSSPFDLSVSGLKKCRHISKIMKEVKLNIRYCFQDLRRSWVVKLENGFELFLGRVNNKKLSNLNDDKILQRVKTFIMAYKKILKKHEKNIDRIDMRYTNGFAIKWKLAQAHG